MSDSTDNHCTKLAAAACHRCGTNEHDDSVRAVTVSYPTGDITDAIIIDLCKKHRAELKGWLLSRDV